MIIEISARDWGTADLAVQILLQVVTKTQGQASVIGIGRENGEFHRAVALRPGPKTAVAFQFLQLPLGADVLVRT